MSYLKTTIISLSDDLEKEDPVFNYTIENKMVFYFLLLYVFWKILLFNPSYSLFENLFIIIFDSLAFAPLLLLGTQPFNQFLSGKVKNNHGLYLGLFYVLYTSFVFLMGFFFQFEYMTPFIATMNDYLFENAFLINSLIIMISIIVFIRLPFYLLEYRDKPITISAFFSNWREYKSFWGHFLAACGLGTIVIYALLSPQLGLSALIIGLLIFPFFFVIFAISQNPHLKYNQGNEGEDVFTFSDLFAMLFFAPCILFMSVLPFPAGWSVFFFLVLLFFGARLPREHFYYSYAPSSGRDVLDFLDMILISLLIFIPLGVLVAFIDLNNFTLEVTFPELLTAICTWTFYVGISEEVIFRCGILILFSDYFKHKGIKRNKTWALALSSIIFGLGHLPKGWNYALLATVAGFAYGLLFLKGRSLFGPILLHMSVDVIAVKFFGADL